MLSDYPMPISIVNFYSSESVGYALKKFFFIKFKLTSGVGRPSAAPPR